MQWGVLVNLTGSWIITMFRWRQWRFRIRLSKSKHHVPWPCMAMFAASHNVGSVFRTCAASDLPLFVLGEVVSRFRFWYPCSSKFRTEKSATILLRRTVKLDGQFLITDSVYSDVFGRQLNHCDDEGWQQYSFHLFVLILNAPIPNYKWKGGGVGICGDVGSHPLIVVTVRWCYGRWLFMHRPHT